MTSMGLHKKPWIFLMLILICYGSRSQETSLSANFRNHIENIMAGYDNWLSQTNDADPTPLLPLVDKDYRVNRRNVHKELFQLNLRLETEQMRGYVQNVQSRTVGQVEVDLARFFISIPVITSGSIIFQGTYTAEGFLNTRGNPPLTGAGTWNFTCTDVVQILQVRFYIDENGFIAFRENIWRLPNILNLIENIYFEGLWDNEPASFYAEEITKQLSLEMQERFRYWYKPHPTGTLLLRYLKETFASTTLEQILGGPTY